MTLPHLTIWTDGSDPFSFGNDGNCSFLFLFFLAGPVSFSSEANAILQALCWSWQHQQVCHFSFLLLLSDSCSILATLSPPPFFFLPQTLWQIWQKLYSLFSCSIRLHWVPATCYSRGTTWLISWPDGERYSRPLQSLVVSLLLSLVCTLVFSRTVAILPHRNFSTHRFPRFSPRNLCSLVTCDLSSLLQRTQLTVKILSV